MLINCDLLPRPETYSSKTVCDFSMHCCKRSAANVIRSRLAHMQIHPFLCDEIKHLQVWILDINGLNGIREFVKSSRSGIWDFLQAEIE